MCKISVCAKIPGDVGPLYISALLSGQEKSQQETLEYGRVAVPRSTKTPLAGRKSGPTQSTQSTELRGRVLRRTIPRAESALTARPTGVLPPPQNTWHLPTNTSKDVRNA